MSGAATSSSGEAAESAAGHPVRRILIIVGLVIVAGAFATLVGWDIRGWVSDLRDTLTSISAVYIVAAVVAVTVQTTATAFAWFSILRYAYPAGEVRWMQVYAAYAACVGMNNILPANLGTFVMFAMLTAVIASATYAGMIGGFLVEKIFFTVAGAFVYLYLFLTVPGSFDIDFSWIKEHPWATAILVTAAGFVIVLVARTFWPKVLKWWEQAKEGGQILAHPRAYFGRVFLPSFVAWVASLCVVAIFLAAYAIPVTFHTVMSVVGSNSISNTVAVTPGGGGRQPGVQRRRPQRRHRLTDRDRLLRRPAARDNGLDAPDGDRPDDLGVRLGRRQDPRTNVVRRGRSESRGTEGEERRQARRRN